jgi:thiosulfate dehydrogenase (quinone) large subunit
MHTMIAFFKSPKASFVWLLLRLYVGYEFLEAGWGKLTGPTPFSAAGTLNNAIKATTGAHPAVQPWYGWFVKNIALPNVGLFSFMVKYGEFLVGLALILGFATIFAASMALLMNFNFLFAGSTSTNTQLVLLEGIIIFGGGIYAGYLGVDYWFRPMFRAWLGKSAADGAASRSAA